MMNTKSWLIATYLNICGEFRWAYDPNRVHGLSEGELIEEIIHGLNLLKIIDSSVRLQEQRAAIRLGWRTVGDEPDEVMQFLDGKVYSLNGIEGLFKYHCLIGSDTITESLEHIPTEAGIATDAYQQAKAKLGGNDFRTFVTEDPGLENIALSLGFKKSDAYGGKLHV
jgi:hypothetical protein